MERPLRRFHRQAQSDGASRRRDHFSQRLAGGEAAENLRTSATGPEYVVGDNENRTGTKTRKAERHQQRRGFVETGIWEWPANQLAVRGACESGRARSLLRLYLRAKRIFFQPQADEHISIKWRCRAGQVEWKGRLLRPGDKICTIRAAFLAGNRSTRAEIGQRRRQLGDDNIAGKLRLANCAKSRFEADRHRFAGGQAHVYIFWLGSPLEEDRRAE